MPKSSFLFHPSTLATATTGNQWLGINACKKARRTVPPITVNIKQCVRSKLKAKPIKRKIKKKYNNHQAIALVLI
jgi:hypothetical protein